MQNKEPDEVNGLLDKVSVLESDNINHTLTKSVSFDIFRQEVRVDRLEKLQKLCILLDYYLVKEPCGKYTLEFDLNKFEKRECYIMLKEIKIVCLNDVKDNWYFGFLLKNTNLADSIEKIREGLRLRKK